MSRDVSRRLRLIREFARYALNRGGLSSGHKAEFRALNGFLTRRLARQSRKSR